MSILSCQLLQVVRCCLLLNKFSFRLLLVGVMFGLQFQLQVFFCFVLPLLSIFTIFCFPKDSLHSLYFYFYYCAVCAHLFIFFLLFCQSKVKEKIKEFHVDMKKKGKKKNREEKFSKIFCRIIYCLTISILSEIICFYNVYKWSCMCVCAHIATQLQYVLLKRYVCCLFSFYFLVLSSLVFFFILFTYTVWSRSSFNCFC